MEALTGFTRTEVLGKPDIDRAFSRIGITRPLLYDLLDMPPDVLHKPSPDCTLRRRVAPPVGLPRDGNQGEIEEKACLFRGPDGACIGAMATISYPAPQDDDSRVSKKT